MVKVKYNIIILFILSILIYGCENLEQPIDWETKNTYEMVVVEGAIFNEYSYQQVRLSLSDDYFSNQPNTKISDAEVTVSDGENTYRFLEHDTLKGFYISEIPFAGVPNRNYTLLAELTEPVNGTSTINAVSEMPSSYDIDSMVAIIIENPFYLGGEDTSLLFVFVEATTVPWEDYYMLVKTYINGIPLFNTISETDLLDDEYNFKDEDRISFLTYDSEDGMFSSGDTLLIEMFVIQKEFMDYVAAVKQISAPPDPFGFSGPKADAIGNINGGTQLGYFYTAFVDRETVIIEEDK